MRVEKDADGFFVASVPALPGCHTQARSLDELMKRVREAIELCLEVEGAPLEPLDFGGVQRVRVSARADCLAPAAGKPRRCRRTYRTRGPTNSLSVPRFVDCMSAE